LRPAVEDIMNNTLKTTLLLATLSGLLLVIGDLIGGQGGLLIAFVLALVMNFGSYWFSDKIVLSMYNATEVGPGHPLYDIVQNLAQRAGLPMPRVYIIPDASPNAFATGRNPEHAAVAATEGILRLLTRDELEGVIAHELAHVKHRDILTSTIAAGLASMIFVIARMAQYAAIFGGGRSNNDREGGASPIGLLAMAILAPFAAMLIQAAISRSREYDADAGGAKIVGHPMGLVNALRKIEAGSKQIPMDADPATAHLFIMKPFNISGIFGLFSTHPKTEDRIQRLLQPRG
jgi:heat shock protein HtpX